MATLVPHRWLAWAAAVVLPACMGASDDFDGDGVADSGDCAPSDPQRFPGANDVLDDGIDQDCDGVDGHDLDRDGYAVDVAPMDCDDGDPAIHPGAVEACDAVDGNCDGSLVDGELDTDADGDPDCIDEDDDDDGTPDVADCAATDASAHPGATELCDGLDSDCDDDLVDDFTDRDGDGTPDCVDDDDGDGATDETDCDDADASAYPGATEACDAVDSDCDADLVDGFDDRDEDGLPDCADPDVDGDGDPAATDCDDTDPTRGAGAIEACDGVDSDCDGSLVDEFSNVDGDADPDCIDDDDGDGDNDLVDCDDNDPTLFSGATEACDLVDANCDGSLVDGFADLDEDGAPDCVDDDDDGDGVTDDLDCDDADANRYPGAAELCDGIDSDCDADLVDDFTDFDGDGSPDCVDPDDDDDGDPDLQDCDDRDDTVYTGAAEACDSVDSDCDLDLVDGFPNLDGDGQPDCIDPDADGDGAYSGDDCDDLDPALTSSVYDANCDGTPEPISVAGLNLVAVPAGTFTMGCTAGQGSCVGSEYPAHQVTLTHRIWVGTTEVTQSAWTALTGNNPAYFGPSGAGADCGGSCPMERVTWFEALAFANLASAADGLPTCYTLTQCTGSVGQQMTCTGVGVNSTTGSPYDCAGYRLPTEAEFEYAARAGTDLRYAGSNTISAVAWWGAWYGGNSNGTTHAVGGKASNAWGLHDMSGNVWELMWDDYVAGYYATSPAEDPDAGAGGSPGIRGGDWAGDFDSGRVSYRNGFPAGDRNGNVGFRIVRTVP